MFFATDQLQVVSILNPLSSAPYSTDASLLFCQLRILLLLVSILTHSIPFHCVESKTAMSYFHYVTVLLLLFLLFLLFLLLYPLHCVRADRYEVTQPSYFTSRPSDLTSLDLISHHPISFHLLSPPPHLI